MLRGKNNRLFFQWEQMFFLMQNIFIAPVMQHGCRAKPLLEINPLPSRRSWHLGPYAWTKTTADNFAIAPSRSAWKVCPHSKNKIGENGVDNNYRENWKFNVWCFCSTQNLKSDHFTSLSEREGWSNIKKVSNARSWRAELLFLLIKAIVLWRSRSRRPC